MFLSEMFSTIKNYSFLTLFFTVLLSIQIGQAQVTLSEQAEISILTCSKGDDLYNTFGHTGIRVRDENQNIDIVFNYGMFSFGGSSFNDQMKFGVKFVRGKLEYWLGVQNFTNFLSSYQNQKRWVYEQVLDLDQSQKQGLFNALMINFEPENRAYQYDFFFDNCSSRVRDMLVDAIGPMFGDEGSPIHEPSEESYIDLIHPYIVGKPWLDLGMDVMLGLHSSRKASHYEFMFLPYHLRDQISLAENLVKSEKMIVDVADRPIGISTFSWTSPVVLFSILFILVSGLSYFNWKKGKHWFAVDRVLLFLSGLIGCLFLFMWLGTDHLPTHINLNMFWAFPLNLIALFFLKKSKWQLYFKFAAGLCTFIFLAWFLSPQQYHYSIIPLAAMFLVRHLKLVDFLSKAKAA
jgi:hypothetical protein